MGVTNYKSNGLQWKSGVSLMSFMGVYEKKLGVSYEKIGISDEQSNETVIGVSDDDDFLPDSN